MVRSKEEMLDKINYYLEHDEEREAIALSGYRKVNEIFNARNAWGYIFEKTGFQMGLDDEGYIKFRQKMESI